jgi:hypothetical protein
MQFTRSDWAQETLHQLQHYKIVQMYSHLIDMGPEYQAPERHSVGIVYLRATDPHFNSRPLDVYDYSGKGRWGCPGGAWAYRRYILSYLGGLIDWQILGSADTLMAKALYGEVEDMLTPPYTDSYKQLARQWEKLANEHVKQNVGYVPGSLLHFWHGKKTKRGYENRPGILVQTKFDPLIDINRDYQGLYQLTGHNIPLRDSLMKLNRSRNEDSMEI